MIENKIKEKYENELMKKENVVGVCTAKKKIGGKAQNEVAICCLVNKKVPLNKLSRKDIIPSKLENIITDVIEVGEIKALGIASNEFDRKARHRPTPMGTSGGHFEVTAGTNGELLIIDGMFCIGTNNHVAALSNEAELGDAYLQPGPYDGGKAPEDIIGNLYRYESIKFLDTPSNCKVAKTIVNFCNFFAKAFNRKTRLRAIIDANNTNKVDAAAVLITNNIDVSSNIVDIGIPKGKRKAHLDMLVQKSGRTTGYVYDAEVTSTDLTVNVSYGSGKTAMFTNQILVSKPGFSAGGDSGSLVLDMENFAVGKLFAGSDKVTIVNHIDDYLDALSAELVITDMEISK